MYSWYSGLLIDHLSIGFLLVLGCFRYFWNMLGSVIVFVVLSPVDWPSVDLDIDWLWVALVLIWLEMVVWMLSVAAHWALGVGFCICVGGGITHLRGDLDSGSNLNFHIPFLFCNLVSSSYTGSLDCALVRGFLFWILMWGYYTIPFRVVCYVLYFSF